MLLSFLVSSFAHAEGNLVIYKVDTPSQFPAAVKNFVNKIYSSEKMSCNPHALYVMDSETIYKSSENLSATFYNGIIRVYGEADASTVKRLGKVDTNGKPYRERAFGVVKENGKLRLSYMSCEAGGY